MQNIFNYRTENKLDNLYIDSKINKTYETMGLDCIEQCRNKLHWLRYPKEVNYQFNSRGFRDTDWPTDLTDAIWCFGDSFTVGMGQPFNEIWPQVLQQQTGLRTINISLNGASNDWITRKILDVVSHTSPLAIIIQWSYLHRREKPDSTLPDEARLMQFDPVDSEDFKNFISNVDRLCDIKCKVIHSWIPHCNGADPANRAIYNAMTDRQLLFTEFCDQLDMARDWHHYDVITSQKYVDEYRRLLGC